MEKTDMPQSIEQSKYSAIRQFFEEGMIKELNLGYFNREAGEKINYKKEFHKVHQLVEDGTIGHDEFIILPEIFLQVFDHISQTALQANRQGLTIFYFSPNEGISPLDYFRSCEHFLKSLIDAYHSKYHTGRNCHSVIFDFCRVMAGLPEVRERIVKEEICSSDAF